MLAVEPPTLGSKAFVGINVNAVFTVRNDAYETADGWKDVKDHTGDYSYEGCAFTMSPLGDDLKKIAYIDENGQSATSPLAFPITDSGQDVVFSYGGDTWYYVSGNVVIDNGNIEFQCSTGSTNLILCDGASLTVQNISAENNLNIYAQSTGDGVGAIVINSDIADNSIKSNKDITIIGGNITIENDKSNSVGIKAKNNVTINGGTITINYAQKGLYAYNYLTINDGIITTNNAADYGLYTYYDDINIKGGEITINNNNAGTGLYNAQGDINISGGTISVDKAQYGIRTNGGNSNINISGGTISVDKADYGIYTKGNNSNINISGGKVVANGTTYGIYAKNAIINLGYSNFGDYIYASKYYGNVNIADGKSFKYDNGTEYVTVSGDYVDTENIAGKYLFPVVNDITLKANSDGNGNYWATFYCGHTGYTADNNTEIYKGTVSDNKVMLASVADIPAGNAVILKSSAPTITLTSAAASADFTDNDLKGTDLDTDASVMTYAYCLANGASGVGFYKYTGNGFYEIIPANRAYLIIPGGNSAPGYGFYAFDETTSIADVRSKMSDVRGDYYDLQGRKVAEPTKGLYIVNGKKVIVK